MLVKQACIFIENCGTAIEAVSLFEEQGQWQGDVYSFHTPDLKTIKEMIVDSLGPSYAALSLTMADIPDIDWVAHVQSKLAPVKAGRFFIHGKHDREIAARQSFAIEIDAAQAFGTAHHDTTLGCLVALDEIGSQQTYQNILDLGTGTGILIIAAHYLWPKAGLTASDIDPLSIDIARENCQLNNVASEIQLICGEGCSHKEIIARAPYDLMIANILSGPLIEMAPSITAQLANQGRLILSGLLSTQTIEVISAYEQCRLELAGQRQFGDWAVLQFIK